MAEQGSLFGPPAATPNPGAVMSFAEARGFKLPLGKHRGRSLDSVAESDDGLLYLDWLSGQDWIKGDTRRALAAYLGDAAIAKELERMVRR